MPRQHLGEGEAGHCLLPVTNIHFLEERRTKKFVMLLCLQNLQFYSGNWSVLEVLSRHVSDMRPWAATQNRKKTVFSKGHVRLLREETDPQSCK